jgi:hypothetical protein
MKTELSFIPHPRRWVPATTAVVLSGAAALLALAVAIVMGAVSMRERLPELRAELTRSDTHARIAAATRQSPAVLPPRASLVSLRQRVARANALLGYNGQPLLQHLALLEKLLPAGAWLVSLHAVNETGTVTLVAESESQDALPLFLQNLEASGQYAEVLLVRQSQREAAAGVRRQFELRLKERT